ncbi:MFS transporter [Achromobacter spanius]|uniref:MFS transporter n=1 Tax=Achromobacter spanius TaxID=217203 RepID=UPI0036ED483B
MSTQQITANDPSVASNNTNATLILMAICSGLGVANVYYLQPSLPLIQAEFGVSGEAVGWLPTITQISYALGMFLLAPLGDVVNRRKLVLVKACLLLVGLIVAGSAHTLTTLIAASAMVGVLGSLGQDFIPAAAAMASRGGRGKAVGIVTTGLLAGILLSRTLGGWVSDAVGWRDMQYVAAALVLLLFAISWRILPDAAPQSRSGYASLLFSLWTLWRKHRALRLSLLTQALLAATLGAFWSCLAMVLAASPFHAGAAVAGSFGIAGAMGAIAAPAFGKLADTRGPLVAIRAGCILVVIAFLGLALLPASYWALAVGAVIFDLGVQAGLVSHQAMVGALDHQARSRTNGLLMTGAMIGMAVGAAGGSLAWSEGGALGLFGFAATAGALALGISFLHKH